jgi:hypothetical protein
MNTSTQPNPRSGPLPNGNRRGEPNTPPRCGAKTRAATPCQSPAMKNGRCRMHGGKCRGPTTEEGRARISAALDKGKMRGKQWQGFNDATSRIHRQGRVYRAMLDARMLVSDIAPMIRDVRAFFEMPDLGYDEASLESTRDYACMGLMALGRKPMAARCLVSRIREAGRRRPTEAQGEIPQDPLHPEDTPEEAAAKPKIGAASESRIRVVGINVRDNPRTVRQSLERPASAGSTGNAWPVSEIRFGRTIFGRHAALLAADPNLAIETDRPAGGCWYMRVTTAPSGRRADPGRTVPLGAIRGPG